MEKVCRKKFNFMMEFGGVGWERGSRIYFIGFYGGFFFGGGREIRKTRDKIYSETKIGKLWRKKCPIEKH